MSHILTLSHTSKKALFRTAALSGSAMIWLGLGYLALTYVPKFDRLITPEGPVIKTIKPLKVIPPPLPPPVTKKDDVVKSVDAKSSEPVLTIRQPTTEVPTEWHDDLPAGTASTIPVIGTGDVSLPISIPEDIVASVPDNPPAPPAVKVVINPVRVSGANPVYPSRPIERGISGEVTLAFTVTASGHVADINLIDEAPVGYGFAAAARRAIQNWTFTPQTIDGVPVAYPARYTISFKLED